MNWCLNLEDHLNKEVLLSYVKKLLIEKAKNNKAQKELKISFKIFRYVSAYVATTLHIWDFFTQLWNSSQPELLKVSIFKLSHRNRDSNSSTAFSFQPTPVVNHQERLPSAQWSSDEVIFIPSSIPTEIPRQSKFVRKRRALIERCRKPTRETYPDGEFLVSHLRCVVTYLWSVSWRFKGTDECLLCRHEWASRMI